eukprot:TRINITY_DN4477_c0_g1_i1.p1 TRINITY_DN4477_c0_g1~~TRINITY_DN4477_c0_g1_i1.p1  ORF type:complete len:116 (+),score=19.32 TRINITY_DN4477_c0_g1_i1:130-477(+)
MFRSLLCGLSRKQPAFHFSTEAKGPANKPPKKKPQPWLQFVHAYLKDEIAKVPPEVPPRYRVHQAMKNLAKLYHQKYPPWRREAEREKDYWEKELEQGRKRKAAIKKLPKSLRLD